MRWQCSGFGLRQQLGHGLVMRLLLHGRVALHAERLEIKHPATGEPIDLTAEWPRDLRVTVK